VIILFASCDSGISNNEDPQDEEIYATETQKSELLESSIALVGSEDITANLANLPIDISNPISQELVLYNVDLETFSATLLADIQAGSITNGKTYVLPMTASSTDTSTYKLIINELSINDNILSALQGDLGLSEEGLISSGSEGVNTYSVDVSFSITKNDEDLLNLDLEFEFDVTLESKTNEENETYLDDSSMQLHKFILSAECANCIQHNMILEINIDETNVIDEDLVDGISNYLDRSDKTDEQKAEYVINSIWSGDNTMYFKLCAYTIADGIQTTYKYDCQELIDAIFETGLIEELEED
jgi:hypothetical protein